MLPVKALPSERVPVPLDQAVIGGNGIGGKGFGRERFAGAPLSDGVGLAANGDCF